MIARLAISLVIGLTIAVPTVSTAAPGPNKLPNPGFEQSVLEPAPVPQYTQPQPLLPNGWIFEGAAGLFDHWPEATGGRTPHDGKRAIAISIPASTKDEICADPPVGCNDNPLVGPRDELRPVYSLTPHWRTLDPITVTAGTAYLFSVWEQHEIVTVGEGATTRVRWLRADGTTVSESLGPQLLMAPPGSPNPTPDNFWKQLSRTLTAPAGAVRAHILLGHTDDSWIGQVRFDDVYFGTA